MLQFNPFPPPPKKNAFNSARTCVHAVEAVARVRVVAALLPCPAYVLHYLVLALPRHRGVRQHLAAKTCDETHIQAHMQTRVVL
eukprot:COSAG06_NODE_417_length_15986_cov_832.025493_15_plen_84_part_00